MNGRRVIGILLCTLAAGALAPAALAMQPLMPSKVDTTYGKLPVRLCLKADAAMYKGLRDGSGQLALEVRNHTAVARYSPTFSVRIADADAGKTKAKGEPRHFGMIADRPAAGGGAEPQHFAFDLSAELAKSPELPHLCVEVDVDHDSDDAKALAATGVTLSVSISSL